MHAETSAWPMGVCKENRRCVINITEQRLAPGLKTGVAPTVEGADRNRCPSAANHSPPQVK